MDSKVTTYAVLGSTGNCGSALIRNLLGKPQSRVHAFCRNKKKLLRLIPEIADSKQVEVFEGGMQDHDLLAACIKNTRAVFMCISTNDNVPGCRLSQDSAIALVKVMRELGYDKPDGGPNGPAPKLLLLSSGTIDPHLSKHLPSLLLWILKRSASHVYADLEKAEEFLRAQESWLTTIYIKPGALSVDKKRGYELSLTEQKDPVSYLDLSAGMIEAADDPEGRWDLKNISVNCGSTPAGFPDGTILCILMGLLRHYFPWTHAYLPMGMGPK
ncbi:Oxidoreductase claK [Fulvia fulva]|uniref:Oxidoreductase claK n=1 Tax=Passalora fulva TaxID=5499 RepID=CLAK_PASFU|nr:Oxidoreductase claK [Fulvia fulva]P0CU69.1 RecName: Full=Oxidoreductase claK; AltName: Full=Cladofulvin biosynthesis cluster protein K [Fulvia fulva]KAK4612280.1 Oxidoreductase claK [Fulvia fulva]KAK4612524.1 Oxidoreductase claK [Fulvia fulva]UJO23487.1 Oxidoreductase claK [Fulvia fulva]WPV21048.1 Oxidoreductase claK [Fulvia fulva]WPV36030.1 Oxidoreductase claK [Fulvia fulva]